MDIYIEENTQLYTKSNDKNHNLLCRVIKINKMLLMANFKNVNREKRLQQRSVLAKSVFTVLKFDDQSYFHAYRKFYVATFWK